MTVTVDDVLAHVGIKGMKWGVSRDNPSGSASHQVDPSIAKKTFGQLATSEKGMVVARAVLMSAGGVALSAAGLAALTPMLAATGALTTTHTSHTYTMDEFAKDHPDINLS